MRRATLAVGFLLFCAGAQRSLLAQSQEDPGLPAVRDVPAIVSFFAPIVIPVKILQDEGLMREYVKSPEFAEARKRLGDRRAVDVLFRKALELCLNNTGEALLVCLLATLEHRTIGIKLPIVGPLLWLPLTGEFEDEFEARVSRLPSNLYADTPPEGDRDKLQHFFGSAFLTVVLESRYPADAVGEAIESGEEEFVVGGVRDPRDERANRQGQRFALALMHELRTLPSGYLTVDGSEENE